MRALSVRSGTTAPSSSPAAGLQDPGGSCVSAYCLHVEALAQGSAVTGSCLVPYFSQGSLCYFLPASHRAILYERDKAPVYSVYRLRGLRPVLFAESQELLFPRLPRSLCLGGNTLSVLCCMFSTSCDQFNDFHLPLALPSCPPRPKAR